MARTSIEDRLADLSEWAAPTFRPAELAEVARRARRGRTRRRALVTAAIAVLACLPAVVFAVLAAGRNNTQPIIEPTSPPVSSAPAVTTFRVTLPGEPVSKHPPSLSFVDRQHVWMLDGSCPDAQTCRIRLLATADGGRTWRQAGYPQIPGGGGGAIVTFLDANTIVVYIPHLAIWLSTDGGQTYTRHEFKQAPLLARLADNGAFALKCPNLTGYGQAQDGGVADCDRQQLVKTGVGPTEHQPPWRGPDAHIDEIGRDGRLWLVDGTRIAYSPDEGKTWHQVPEKSGKLRLSASGEQVGLWAADGELYRLSGDRWVMERRPPGWKLERMQGVLLDDGSWLMSDYDSAGYLIDGVYSPIPEVGAKATPVKQLADGTLVLSHFDSATGRPGFFMGTGQGRARQWTLVIY
ncbi:hypothetical protein Rhe02_94610 [Rhizocola hellebori]|uniref:Uncharacterized protein n=1 Tax=Rhizocola hellebori TaxID=1392758 RepID=A0A8J3VLF5_9ACTN|nr:hypothetical protein [Rhizocola hellebori]GIH11394.1 hypothetical protein Rhe02_94610 [Rhizocola hellebori]